MSSDSSTTPGEVRALAQELRMILLDVDGVLTDGGIIIISGEAEAKRFNAQDGMGITLAQAAGLEIGIVTARNSEIVQRRANELGIQEVYQGARHKGEVLEIILEKRAVEAKQIAFIGDDVQDLPIMRRVGISIAVQNAIPAVKACSTHVTRACGGNGAVREAIEWLLELRGDLEKVYRQYTGY